VPPYLGSVGVDGIFFIILLKVGKSYEVVGINEQVLVNRREDEKNRCILFSFAGEKEMDFAWELIYNVNFFGRSTSSSETYQFL
jgi:hypothetical protein